MPKASDLSGEALPGDPATPSRHWSFAMPNTLVGLKQALNGLGVWLEDNRVDMETENRARLVFEEIVTNVIRYGFTDKNNHVIHTQAEFVGSELSLSFDDDGRPFDPTTAPDLPPAASLAHASVGGRGLMLVRAASRTLEYERTSDGHNRLVVVLSQP